MSRSSEFVGPSYQEEFIRRRLLELEEQLVKLSRDEWFEGIWEREVVEKLSCVFGGEVEPEDEDEREVAVGEDEEVKLESDVEDVEDTSVEDTNIELENESQDETEDEVDLDDTYDSPFTNLNRRPYPNPPSFSTSPPSLPTTTFSTTAQNNCTSCKLAKKGCDRHLPKCSRCVKAGRNCDYDLGKLRRGPRGGVLAGKWEDEVEVEVEVEDEEGDVEMEDKCWD